MKDRFSLGVALGVALTVVVGGSLAYGPELLDLPVAQAKKRQKKAAPSSAKTRLPNGRSLMPIKNGVYPRDYFPNTEKLGPNEMRIVALGTGMPQVIQKKTKASGWYVELGNGEKFLFDLGTGSMENLAALQPDWSQVDTVFLSHLHSDHAGDFAPLYIGGWMNGRYTPLHIYGPTGSRPELGTKAFVENQVKAWAWDIEGRKGSFPDAGGRALVKEFDYKKVQVIYDENGVKVTQFPAIHALDGSVSFRMEWGKRSFVFGGDSAPNNWYIEHAKGAEVAVHECFYTPEGLANAMDIGMKEATYISSYVHTPPAGFGKIMSAVRPRLAVGYHIWPNPEYMNQTLHEVAKTYDGEYVQATDLTVINVTDKQIVVRDAVVSELALPTGTTKEYLEAFRSEVDANSKITEYLSSERWKGFKPPPLPER
jgi:ribonuclease Z